MAKTFTDCPVEYTASLIANKWKMSHHLNNIEYIKFALNVFSEKHLLNHEVRELEVHYTGESKEGQTLKILRCDKAEGTYIKINESDRSVFEMKIRF